MKGKGTVKVAVRDIFYTQPPKGDINFKSTEAHFRSLWDSRQVSATFTYRFGKPFKVEGPQRRERSPEEQNRVKGGWFTYEEAKEKLIPGQVPILDELRAMLSQK